MKNRHLFKAFLAAALVGVSLVFNSCSKDDDSSSSNTNGNSQEQTETKLVSELKCTVAEFASKYETLKKGEKVSVTLTDVSDANIAQVSETLRKMSGAKLSKAGSDSYIVVLLMESKDELKKIPAEIFKGCTAIVSVSIPECVELIESGAFDGCTALEAVKILSEVVEIQEGAFDNTNESIKFDAPESVVIPEINSSIEAKLLSPADIVDYVKACDEEVVTLNMALETYDHTDVIIAISKCDKKVNLVIPDGVENLDYVVDERSPLNEWEYNTQPATPNLVSVSIPENVTVIGRSAFYNSGISEVELPSGLKEIEEGAFCLCSNLSKINLPSSLTAIGGSAFANTNISKITLPASLASIGGSAFNNCNKLVEVVIPDGVKEILPGTFAYCANLANVTIPNSVEFVAYNAFERTSLPSLNLPSSVKNWGDYVFKDGNLVEIVIPESVDHLDEYAFFTFEKLKSVVIKGNVETLETAVFSHCKSLEKVILPDGLKEIKQAAFSDCVNLKEIELPSSLTFIDLYSFSGTGLREITIPENVKSIVGYAFMNCENLTSVTISAEDLELGDWIFQGCDQLQSIYCSETFYRKHNSSMYPQMKVLGGDEAVADNSYTQITFQKQYGAMNFTPEDDYESVVFEFEEIPSDVQITITSDLFEKEESWGDSYYAAYYGVNDYTVKLDLNAVFYEKFAALENGRGESASKITTIAIQNAADGKNVVKLKRVVFKKTDGSDVVLKKSDDGFDFGIEVIR